MKNRTLHFVLVLVFLFTGILTVYGNNKHFYESKNGVGLIDGDNRPITDDYKLNQNFPNPFNPSTKISYKINIEGIVTLQVFNLVGQVVKVLVNEFQKPGRYEVEFDAGDLPSGVYLYKLQINDFTSVKRMTLLR